MHACWNAEGLVLFIMYLIILHGDSRLYVCTCECCQSGLSTSVFNVICNWFEYLTGLRISVSVRYLSKTIKGIC